MYLKDINKNRTQIMGIATLLVILTHIWTGNETPAISALHRFTQNGVDIFLFLSGIGCYYSLQYRTVKEFYLRRIVRVLPSYLFVLIAWISFQYFCWGAPIYETWKDYSMISFFTVGNIPAWFIGAILVLYLITPWFYKLLDHSREVFFGIFTFIIIWASQTYFYYFSDTYQTILELFICRIPIYMLGLWVGRCLVRHPNLKIKINSTFVVISCLFAGLYYWNSYSNTINTMGVCHYISLFLAPIMTIWLALFFNKVKIPLLSMLGESSLEAYLLNEKIVFLLIVYLIDANYWSVNIIAFVLTILFAYVLHKILNFNKKGKMSYGS